MPRGFRDRLVRRARRIGQDLPNDVAERLAAYYDLLVLWNRKVNLTGIQDTDQAIDRLLLEPLAAARHMPSVGDAIDVGSGGGSPAIPLSLAIPGLAVRMVESKARKAAFLREVVRKLQLVNVTVEAARYEELLVRPELHEAADAVTLRAVKIDSRALTSLQALVRPGGRLFLFRAAGTKEVAEDLPPGLTVAAVHPLVESLRSHLVIIEKHRVGLT
jgi:16S rRNA (guanine527-N7)-methyltransferase